MKHKWIVEVVITIAVFAFICVLVTAFVQSIRQENTCWRAGYERPVSYAGTWYCFGRDGQPELAVLETLQESQ